MRYKTTLNASPRSPSFWNPKVDGDSSARKDASQRPKVLQQCSGSALETGEFYLRAHYCEETGERGSMMVDGASRDVRGY